MILVISVFLISVGAFVWLGTHHGIEASLPFFAFVAVLSPLSAPFPCRDCSI